MTPRLLRRQVHGSRSLLTFLWRAHIFVESGPPALRLGPELRPKT